jgi:HTH-type transcriptional regulator/antitoxin HigA
MEIHTRADYLAALKIASVLVDADPQRGTPDGDRLEVIGALLEAYEAKHCLPIASVAELKGMFGKTKKAVSIDEMNAAIAARGASAR